MFNVTIVGICSFACPGIWSAMNSLGAGGAASPNLINAANAITFSLMVLSSYMSSALMYLVGVKGALIFGWHVPPTFSPQPSVTLDILTQCTHSIGYAPFAAGLYTNNRYGNEWFVLLGAALCGISAGVFWAAEASIAIAYPEPWNRGKALGYWLSFKLFAQMLGGAINLGLNANNDQAGQVSYTVFLVFIAIQAAGPFIGFLLNSPDRVERKDGKKVDLTITQNPWREIKATNKLFFTKKFLLLLLWIGNAVFSESVFFTYLAMWFSVRSRALGSLMSGIVPVIAGNILGYWLDRGSISLKIRSRVAFWTLVIFQGAWWTWATVLVTRFKETKPTYDWTTPGFGAAFGVFVFLAVSFQLNYLFSWVFIPVKFLLTLWLK